jgi:hypothetical protein
MLYIQHNTVCDCIYIHTNITTHSMTQLQCSVFFFFLILLIYFRNSNVLIISQFQWLISAEDLIT